MVQGRIDEVNSLLEDGLPSKGQGQANTGDEKEAAVIDINARDPASGWTAMHFTCLRGNLQVAPVPPLQFRIDPWRAVVACSAKPAAASQLRRQSGTLSCYARATGCPVLTQTHACTRPTHPTSKRRFTSHPSMDMQVTSATYLRRSYAVSDTDLWHGAAV
eukprot:3940612-Rhodomonas_salina.2